MMMMIIFDQTHESFISQGTALTFFRYGGQVDNHLCEISSGL